MKLPKTPQNGGLPQDFFRRAKRAGKTLVLGFQEKNTLSVTSSFDSGRAQRRPVPVDVAVLFVNNRWMPH